MTSLNEDKIETLCIQRLQQALGCQHLYGPDIAPDGPHPLRDRFDQVLLLQPLQAALERLNPHIPPQARADALRQLTTVSSPQLVDANEALHRLLTEGVTVNFQQGGLTRGGLLWALDFEHPQNNEFTVVNQFTVVENNINKRPDVILFVNGLPLVLIELKNPADEDATLQAAFRQIQTYKAEIPSLFTYNALLVISDGLEARMGALSADYSRFTAWKTADGLAEADPRVSQLETLIAGLLNPATLLDLIRHFTVFERTAREDLRSGQVAVEKVKKIAAYHQYYAVNRAVASTLRAAGYNKDGLRIGEPPQAYGLPSTQDQAPGDRRAGVMWHTQGSGKSLSMLFYAGKIVRALDNPTILVITDRNDLDDQLFDTFSGCVQLLRQEPVQARSREHLQELLRVASGGVVFSTIQKFYPDDGAQYPLLSERANIIVIADEAHRTQYGFRARAIDQRDERGRVAGQRVAYGFAKYMRDALPNASFIGFTGTPIENDDINTPAVFGNYIDIYDIARAVQDGATVRIYYENRLAKVELSAQGRRLVRELDADLAREDLSETQQAKARWTQLEALVGSQRRLQNVARDIVAHFEQRELANRGKAMIVTMSRRIAAEMYAHIVEIRPHWHQRDLDKGAIKVVMTAASSDGPLMAKHHTNKAQRRALAERMKNPHDPLKLVIVCDMWLTGFDVPCLHTMYLDKPMKGHTLMQAIARVNRVYHEKEGGLIVDYLGIAADLKQALAFYSDGGGRGDPALMQAQAVELMREKLEVVRGILYGFDYRDYFAADTSSRLSLILAAQDFILGVQNGKKRFVDEVAALSRAFAIAIPHEDALAVRDEVAFFQAVKARLVKFDSPVSGRSQAELETAIRQVIDRALVSDQVVDIFDAAGIKKPDISILSEDFLMEIRGMQHTNLALETLRKLLNDEIKARARRNLVQSRSLMDMLEQSIQRYHNKIITAAEVIEELIKLSREIREMDREPEEMGLTQFEYAFYTAVANNKSARELMQVEKLRELAVVLYDKVRSNASIDWTIRESARARLRVIVKRTLRRYGYPPDMEKLATETVLEQAELIADELTTIDQK